MKGDDDKIQVGNPKELIIKAWSNIGQKAIDDKRRQLILEIISIIFMVVPFVGGAAMVGRIFTLVAEGANIAMTVASIVADPASAPYAILGLLAGAGVGGGGGGGKISKVDAIEGASSARGLMRDGGIGGFPQSFKDKDALIPMS